MDDALDTWVERAVSEMGDLGECPVDDEPHAGSLRLLIVAVAGWWCLLFGAYETARVLWSWL